MTHTYDVHIWDVTLYEGKRVNSYLVRRLAGTREWKERFRTRALADSFRSDLVTAARRGEAFDTATGRPVSAPVHARPAVVQVRLRLHRHEVAHGRRDLPAQPLRSPHRHTVAVLDNDHDRPDPKVLRSALHRWAFNTARRDTPLPADIAAALRWAERTAPPVSRLADPAILRRVLVGISTRLDGRPGARRWSTSAVGCSTTSRSSLWSGGAWRSTRSTP